MITKSCEDCGVDFKVFPSRKNQKFCSQSCFMKKRNRENPQLRFSAKTKNSFIITEKCKDYIDGLLLGDACVKKPRSKLKYSTRLTQTFSRRFEGWAKKIVEDLSSFGIQSTLTFYDYFDKRTKKKYFGVSLQTRTYPEFILFYKRWYPYEKKEVPKDISFNPTVLKNWFLGDGSRPHGGIQLSTDAFDEESIKLLLEGLSELDFSPRLNKQNRIQLYKGKETKRFINKYIMDIPRCFHYKGVV